MCSDALLNLVEIFPFFVNVFLNVVNLLETPVKLMQWQQQHCRRLNFKRIVIDLSQVDYNFSVHLLNPLKAPIFYATLHSNTLADNDDNDDDSCRFFSVLLLLLIFHIPAAASQCTDLVQRSPIKQMVWVRETEGASERERYPRCKYVIHYSDEAKKKNLCTCFLPETDVHFSRRLRILWSGRATPRTHDKIEVVLEINVPSTNFPIARSLPLSLSPSPPPLFLGPLFFYFMENVNYYVFAFDFGKKFLAYLEYWCSLCVSCCIYELYFKLKRIHP